MAKVLCPPSSTAAEKNTLLTLGASATKREGTGGDGIAVAKGSGLGRLHGIEVPAIAPVLHRLVVQISCRFWQKSGKELGNPKLIGGVPAIVGTTGAPEVQDRAFQVKTPHLFKHRRHRNSLGSDGTHQGVVNIDKYYFFLHIFKAPKRGWSQHRRPRTGRQIGLFTAACVRRASARLDVFYPRFALGDASLIKPLGTLPKRLQNMVEKALGLS